MLYIFFYKYRRKRGIIDGICRFLNEFHLLSVVSQLETIFYSPLKYFLPHLFFVVSSSFYYLFYRFTLWCSPTYKYVFENISKFRLVKSSDWWIRNPQSWRSFVQSTATSFCSIFKLNACCFLIIANSVSNRLIKANILLF